MKLPQTHWGHGPIAAFFLHGFTGSAESFSHLAPLLGNTVSARCVDLPGHRGTDFPPQETDTAFLQLVDTLAAAMRRPTVVVGYSQGARLALALALRHPACVTRLVLESPSPGLRQRAARARRAQRDEAMAEFILAEGVAAFVQRWEKRPLLQYLEALPPSTRSALRRRRLGHTAWGLAAALRRFGQGVQPNFWPALRRLSIPTLLLTGACDTKYTRIARRMASQLPRSWHVTFPHTGHAPHLECPQAYAQALRSFMTTPTYEAVTGSNR